MNEIENLDWNRLEREQKNAAGALGYDRYSWDCWQNHYQSYRWIDLDNPYVQVGQWWDALGWDIYSWNQLSDAPESDGMLWYELGDVQRAAAAQLCYFRTIWDEDDVLYDGFPIERPEFRYMHWMKLGVEARGVANEKLKYSALSWNVLGLDSIESRTWRSLTEYERNGALGLGWSQLSWDCWQNHYKGYSWDELEFYGLDFPFLKLGWDQLSWDGIESAPATSKDHSWKDLTPEQRASISELCYFRDNWDGLDMTPNPGQFPFPKVKQRYVAWRSLAGDVRKRARDSLMYNRTTWNLLGSAEIEQRSWEGLTEHQKADAMALGYYRKTWDCFVNHYRAYRWEDLDRVGQDSLQSLGWDEASWEQGSVPPSYNNTWVKLSDQEQSVASVLCFFEDNWDGNNLEIVGIEPIAEDDVSGAAEDGNGPDATIKGGPASSDPPNEDKISEILNQGDGRARAVNSVDMIGTRGVTYAVFGTLIQLLL